MADRVPSDERLRAAVRALNHMDPQPDLVVGTGDLVNDGDRDGGAPDQYRTLAGILEELRAPAVMIPGNHDSRERMREFLPGYLGPSSQRSEPLFFELDDFPLRILALDTTIPGAHHGEIGVPQLTWLAGRLEEHPTRPTLIIQHHPPFESGMGFMDEMGLTDAASLENVLMSHPQVVGVLCGHLHRSILSRFAHSVAITAPSTGAQLALRLNDERYQYSSESPAFAVHLWDAADPYRLRSHVRAIDEGEVWKPEWAKDLQQ
jgi:Icc protein